MENANIPNSSHPATIERMGHPVPEGWNQPSRWPAKRYEDLRDGVLFLYDRECQMCGKATRFCSKINSKEDRTPENLIALCRSCSGGKLLWTSEDAAKLSEIAIKNAEMIRRMTGFGLKAEPYRPVPPKKRKKAPHRPRKENPQSVRIVFRITQEQYDRVAKHRKNFHGNSYARNRFLGKKNENVYAQMPLEAIGAKLKDAEFDASYELSNRRKKLKTLLQQLQKTHDPTLIRELAIEIDGCFTAIADLKKIAKETVSELGDLIDSI